MSLLDLASRFTTLRRAGRQFAGPCPLPGHAVDKTPSFFITLDDTRWFCWSCGVGGGYRALHAALLGEGLPGGDRPPTARPRPKKPCLELTPWGAFAPSAEAAVQALLASLPAWADRTAEATAWARARARREE